MMNASKIVEGITEAIHGAEKLMPHREQMLSPEILATRPVRAASPATPKPIADAIKSVETKAHDDLSTAARFMAEHANLKKMLQSQSELISQMHGEASEQFNKLQLQTEHIDRLSTDKNKWMALAVELSTQLQFIVSGSVRALQIAAHAREMLSAEMGNMPLPAVPGADLATLERTLAGMPASGINDQALQAGDLSAAKIEVAGEPIAVGRSVDEPAEDDSLEGVDDDINATTRTDEQPATIANEGTFVIPDGYEAVRDQDGRATGMLRPIEPSAASKLLNNPLLYPGRP